MGAPVGNENAKKGKDYRLALRRALARKSGSTASEGLKEIAGKLVEAAYAGEAWAIKEVADRVDGRPAQAIVGDSDEDPISVVNKVLLGDLSDRGDS